MPSAALAFRASCGCFHAVFIAFMCERAKEKAALRFAKLTPRSRLDGVTLGLTLVYLFWGSLLLRCGDIEQNPGPESPAPKATRQSTLKARMTSSSRSASSDRSDNNTTNSGEASPSPVLDPPSMTDIWAKLVATETTMKSIPTIERKMEEVRQRFISFTTTSPVCPRR